MQRNFKNDAKAAARGLDSPHKIASDTKGEGGEIAPILPIVVRFFQQSDENLLLFAPLSIRYSLVMGATPGSKMVA